MTRAMSFVGLVLDEVRGLGPRPGLAKDRPALFVDAVDQDRQQQAVVGVAEVEQPFPAFDVEVHRRVEPLAPRPGVDAAGGLGGEPGRIILRSVEERLVDPVVDPGDAGKHGVIGGGAFGQDVARQPHERAHPVLRAPETRPCDGRRYEAIQRRHGPHQRATVGLGGHPALERLVRQRRRARSCRQGERHRFAPHPVQGISSSQRGWPVVLDALGDIGHVGFGIDAAKLASQMTLSTTAVRSAVAKLPEKSQLRLPTANPRIARSAIRLSGSSWPS